MDTHGCTTIGELIQELLREGLNEDKIREMLMEEINAEEPLEFNHNA